MHNIVAMASWADKCIARGAQAAKLKDRLASSAEQRGRPRSRSPKGLSKSLGKALVTPRRPKSKAKAAASKTKKQQVEDTCRG